MLGRRKRILIPGATPEPAQSATLARFDATARGEWQWVQLRRFRPYWELDAGAGPVATLRNCGAFARKMRFELADAVYEIRSRFAHGIDLAREGDDVPMLHFAPSFWRGGRIDSAAGEIDVAGWTLFHRSVDFRTPEKLPLVHFKSRDRFARHDARIAIEDAARTRADLAPLLAMGFALLLLSRRRSE